MQFAFRLYVRIVGFLRRNKMAESKFFTIDHDGRSPLISMSGNTEKAAFVSNVSMSYVLQIDGMRNIAQIDKSVIGGLSVDVVNRVLRPIAGHVQPCQSMRKISLRINVKKKMPTTNVCPGGLANIRMNYFRAPNENPRLGVVMHKFAQALRCQWDNVFSHDAPRKRIGQRPVDVFSIAPALPF